jgi:hypothetical protein
MQQSITHFQATFKFPVGPTLTNHIRALASRLVLLFVRHASLIRPLKEAGKLRLAADMAQLEFAIAPLMSVKELGYPYKALRAFRPFIFRETSQLAECPESQVLSPSVVLHHLFSRASLNLQYPHVIKGWSIAYYSDWLDKHSEEDVWSLIKYALETYAAQVNARGEKEFTPIYPVILSLGPVLLQKWKDRNL